ncbi:MAG: class I SAM-dependent methyltransferase, partial [Pyrinomonadaceae bacterium]
GPLPTRGFRAQITLPDPPTKLRVGQKETVNVRIKNTSDVFWWARGGETNDRNDNKFYIAVGDRWLDASGKLLTEMDGRMGISKDMRPGEELEIPLPISAPGEPGEYLLEVDLVQEQVSWFGDKGSPTARTKITVVR